jgi:hypothetical protein
MSILARARRSHRAAQHITQSIVVTQLASLGSLRCNTPWVAGFGWNYPFAERAWADVREFLSAVDWRSEDDKYQLAIIDSVLRFGADGVLAVATSMHDLVVAPRPATGPPTDVVIVCGPGSLRKHPENTIRVDFQTVGGGQTEIVRPSSDALPLFWRTVDTAFGVRPASLPRVTIVHTKRGMLLTKDTYLDWREVQDHLDDYIASLGPYSNDELLDYLAVEYPTNPPFPPGRVAAFLQNNEQHLWST